MNDSENVKKDILHKPVLLQEVLHFLAPRPGKIYVDVTLGGGGHTRAILQAEPSCTVIGMDWDESVIQSTGVALQQEFPGRFIPVWGNFSKINAALQKIGYTKVDGILADFGTSQIQIAQTPGLSIYQNKFLDMRMSKNLFQVTAYDVVKNYSQKDLARIFFEYGQERYGNKIAQAIVEARKKSDIKTTVQLAKLIETIVPHGKNSKIHVATKVFQALRIYVNKELENIQAFLVNSTKILDHDSRLVCISFHSLEDRLVKVFFKDLQKNKQIPVSILTPKVCVATKEELLVNRSARSAKLRALQFDI
jgi:16S rRNA (cytosine1402-N4)-methyltransferase